MRGLSASARIALAWLLYTTCCSSTPPPVAHLSLKPGIHLSRLEYLSLMHKYLSFPPAAYLFPPYICISHISVSAKYLSRPNVFIYHIFVSQSRCLFLVSFPGHWHASIFCQISFLRNCSVPCHHIFSLARYNKTEWSDNVQELWRKVVGGVFFLSSKNHCVTTINLDCY